MSEELTNKDVQLKILKTIDHLLYRTNKDSAISDICFKILSTEQVLDLSKAIESLSVAYNGLHLKLTRKGEMNDSYTRRRE